jgi:hypothetical protein
MTLSLGKKFLCFFRHKEFRVNIRISRSTPTVNSVSVFREVLTLGIYVVTKELTLVKQCLCISQDIPNKNEVY